MGASMKWGLLGGLGKGLVQAGDTLNRGLNADIQARRQDELEARREASIERRWRAQEARQAERDKISDERHEREMSLRESQAKRQTERDKVSDAQFDRSMNVREAQQIERNLTGIFESQQKAENEIVKRYQSQAVDSLGQPLQGDAMKQLESAMQAELLKTREQYSAILQNRVKSYGDKLKGTGFAYLLDLQAAGNEQPEQELRDDRTLKQGSDPREDLALKIITGGTIDLETGEPITTAGTPREKSFLDKAVGGGTPDMADATFAAAFARGLGGVYKNSARPVDENRSPFESAANFAGRWAGFAPGLMGDAAQIVNDTVVQPIWEWGNKKPDPNQQ